MLCEALFDGIKKDLFAMGLVALKALWWSNSSV
jgi:hypothetical protein